jgi:2-haloacid dehalogenase
MGLRYDWLLLDADGTLFDYDRAEAAALDATLIETGLGARDDAVETYRQINSAVWEAFERGEILQAALRTARFERLFAALGIDADAAAVSEQYLTHLGQQAMPVDGAEELVRALHGVVGMVVITNGLQDVQRSRFALSPLTAYLDDIVISEEVGAAKPAPAIFDRAFACMGHPERERVLIVGDSLSSDMAGGNAYGIDTCWYNPAGTPRDPAVPVRYEIRRLDEVVDIVHRRWRGT